MADLIQYDEKLVSKGQGFVNLGATCYFNSLLQCLLSCPAIYKVLSENRDKPHIAKNSLARNLLSLWDKSMRGEPIYQDCIPIWRDIIAISQKQNNRVRMDMGQQDASEGLMMFLDATESIPDLHRLFEHRHRTQIYCEICSKAVVDKRETNLVFEAQPDLKTEQLEKYKDIDEYYNRPMDLNDFLKKQNGYVDEAHTCPECKKKCEKFRSTTLTMIPEILPVVFKKYYKKHLTPFPSTLSFPTKGGTKKLMYQLVAQSEHAGGMGGGHYWATCLRSDGWKNLNDGSVSDGRPGPTENTYIIFYHYIGEVDA